MLAFLTNLGPTEFVLVLVLAVLIFGRRLPEVAAKGAVQLQRLRRGLQEFRRESGFDEEIRRARRMIENPIKGALEEAEKEPASWRPPSPRVSPHPNALESTEPDVEAQDEDSPAEEPIPDQPRQALVNEEEPDARS